MTAGKRNISHPITAEHSSSAQSNGQKPNGEKRNNAENPVRTTGTLERIKRIPASWKLSLLLSIFLLLAIGIIVGLLLLPIAVESQINYFLQNMTSQNGSIRVDVRSIGLFRSDVAFFVNRHIPTPSDKEAGEKEVFKPLDSPFLEDSVSKVESCTIRYSPLRLILQQQIDSITIGGAEMRMDFRNGQFHIPILDLLKQKTGQAAVEQSDGGQSPFPMPFQVNEITVNGMIQLELEQESALIPFQISVAPKGRGHWEQMKFRLSVSQSRNTIHLNGEYLTDLHLLKGELSAVCDTKQLPLTLRNKLPQDLHGRLALQSFYFEYDAGLHQLLKADGNGTLAIHGTLPGMTLNLNPVFNIVGDANHLSLAVSGDSTVSFGEQNIQIKQFHAIWDEKKQILMGDTTVVAGDNHEFKLTSALAKNEKGTWALTFNSSPDDQSGQIALSLGNTNLSCKKTEFVASVLLDDAWKIQGMFSGNDLAWKSGPQEAFVKQIQMTFSGTMKQMKCSLKATAPSGKLNDAIPFHAKQIALSGVYSPGAFSGNLILDDGEVSLNPPGLSLKQISLDLPLVYPMEESSAREGSFCIGGIFWKENELASVKSSILTEQKKWMILGTTNLLNLKTDFVTEIDPFFPGGLAIKNTVSTPRQPINQTFGLKKVFPKLIGDKVLTGDFELGIKYDILPDGQSGTLTAKLTDCTLESKEMGLVMTGLNLGFLMPRLPELSSKANQVISFKQLTYNQIKMDSARIRFRMESPEVWYVDSLLLNWCKGKIRMESTKLAADTKRTAVVLHCDRLDLVDFLSQTGVGVGTGNGSSRISGTIPVVFRNNQIIFRDGFLFSTPGEEGLIKFELNDSIKASQPNSTVFALTQDALRDFSYSWARVQVNTDADNLKIQMQLNGKPVNPLPYTYDKGEFIRSTIPNIFQGILLDVNAVLPLSDLLRVTNSISNLLNKGVSP